MPPARLSPLLRHLPRHYHLLGTSRLPPPRNEPAKHYLPHSPERAALRAALQSLSPASRAPTVIPAVVNGVEEYPRAGEPLLAQPLPHRHADALCAFQDVPAQRPELVRTAVEGAVEARRGWAAMPVDERVAVFVRAAEMLAGVEERVRLCASVMLGQGKTVWQAEIDAALETIDFWRFGAAFAKDVYAAQPAEHSPGVWNRMEYRPLEGFVAAISPFNFIAIGANLPSSPAIMGNVALWKPAESAMHASYLVYKLLEKAGLPPGVIQFIPGNGPAFSDIVLRSPHLAGLHFTGSSGAFNSLWKQVAANLDIYNTYPRVVGETGGKNFHFVHSSANVDHVVNCTIRGAFEYSGQKCSATSRMYVPESLWPAIKAALLEQMPDVRSGPVEDFSSFLSAVINRSAFDRIKAVLDRASDSDDCEILSGGRCDDVVGYYVEPTVIHTTNPHAEVMTKEIFGPVLAVYVYKDEDFESALQLCDSTSLYGLTGAIFAQDRMAVSKAMEALRDSAGNFYINNQCTGSIVGQQPFGGSRRSGTNDKSGSVNNLLRWVSPRSIKEGFEVLSDWKYPHMQN